MQDHDAGQDDQAGARKPMEPGPTPEGHEHINREGMENGVPEGADEGSSLGGPSDDRRQSETAARDDNRSDK